MKMQWNPKMEGRRQSPSGARWPRWVGLWVAVCPGLLAAGADPAELMKQSKFREAQAVYEAAAERQPGDLRLRYNAGVAAYRAGDSATAQRHFEAALASPDLRLQQQAWYNLGTSRFQQAEAAEADGKVDELKNAGKAFQAAAELTPTDRAASENFAAIQQLVEQLEKQPPQPQDGQDSKDDQKKSKDKKDKKDQKDSKGSSEKSKGDQKKGNDKDQADASEQGQGDPASEKSSDTAKNNHKKGQPGSDKTKSKSGDSKSDPKDPSKDSDRESELANQKTNRPPTLANTNRTDQADPKQQAGKKPDGKDPKSGGDQSGIQRAQPSDPGGDEGSAGADAMAAAEEVKPGEGERMTVVQAQQMLDAQKGSEKPLWTLFRGWGQDQKQPAETSSRRKTW